MRIASITLVCMTLLAGTANAQSYRFYNGSPHHASTAAESYARGRADIIRSQGQYNLLSSQAIVNMTEAYRRSLQNHVARTETFFRMREINRSNRLRTQPNRAVDKSVATHTPVSHGSGKPSPKTLDLSRDLDWPAALRGEAFAEDRQLVEKFIERKTKSVMPLSIDNEQLEDISKAIVAKLRIRVHECSPQEYVDAKVFIAALGRSLDTRGI